MILASGATSAQHNSPFPAARPAAYVPCVHRYVSPLRQAELAVGSAAPVPVWLGCWLGHSDWPAPPPLEKQASATTLLTIGWPPGSSWIRQQLNNGCIACTPSLRIAMV